MMHPTIEELTCGDFNRYELALATAKCARKLTETYAEQMAEAEEDGADFSRIAFIQQEYREEKPVQNAVNRLYSGEYRIIRTKED